MILAVFFFMAKFFTGFAVGLVAAALIAVLLIVAAVRLGSPKPTVAANSALVLHLEGDVPEQAPVDVPVPFLEGQQPMTMVEIWRLLQTAAADNRIKSLIIEPSGLTAGWAGLEELRADILAFKKSGKPVHAYLRGAATHDYYVATAADDIYMAPEDELDVKGLRAELVYVKGTLDKLGVSMEFEHVGKYKDAPDQFTKTGPSPETLEVENQILDQYFGDIVHVIADGRKKTPDAVRALIDDGPFVGKSALDGGLVDGLIFEDEMYQKFGNPAKIGGRSYAQAQAGSSLRQEDRADHGRGRDHARRQQRQHLRQRDYGGKFGESDARGGGRFVDSRRDSADQFAGRRRHRVR